MLRFEYHDDADMLAILDGDPPVRDRLVVAANKVLMRLRVSNPAGHADDLVTLSDALVAQRLLQNVVVDAEAIVRSYLAGLVYVVDQKGTR